MFLIGHQVDKFKIESVSSPSDEPATQSGSPTVREQVLAFFGPQSEEHETKRALADHLRDVNV
jgi:hypothetical protein